MFGRKKRRTKYAGKPLSPDTIDAQRLTNDHRRSERKKDTQTNIEVMARYGAFAALPLIFVGLILADLYLKNYGNLVTHLTGIGGSLVGYLFGKGVSKPDE